MSVVISGSGISGPDGSAGSPPYEGTDTDTGIFFPAAGAVAISTDGTERLRVSGSNLFMGTTSSVPVGGQAQLVGYNVVGGTGFHTFLAVQNTFGSATNPYKYLRLNSSGGIEVINSAYNAVIFTMDNSGNFTAAGNVTAYSDVRLKTNIHPLEDSLTKVQQLQGVSYERKSDGAKKIGFIAQDLQKVLPEVVIENHDGMLSVDYGNIVALLTEAIKEQQKQIEALQAQIQQLAR